MVGCGGASQNGTSGPGVDGSYQRSGHIASRWLYTAPNQPVPSGTDVLRTRLMSQDGGETASAALSLWSDRISQT